ncbi:MAG: RES family NAD+ phosphorylase [Gemmatimonadota bacterium]
MRLYRLCRSAHRALDGEGARLYGGRWNSPGHGLIYTSRTLSLAALEYLVHLDPAFAPADLVAMTLELPDFAVAPLDPTRLPTNWRSLPAPPQCAALGDSWLAGNHSLGLAVPSAIVPVEWNVLLDPRHAEFGNVRLMGEEPFQFDRRLLTK